MKRTSVYQELVAFDFSNLIFDISYSVESARLSSHYGALLKRYTERMPQSDLVVVQSYATEVEAFVAKGVLESSGIDARLILTSERF